MASTLNFWFFLIHIFLLKIAPTHSEKINLLCSATFQMVGGLIILYSINSQLGLFSNTSMKGSIINWIKRFPLKAQNTIVVVPTGLISTSSLSAEVVIAPKLSTIEEKIEYLFKENKRIDSKINLTKNELKGEIQSAFKKANKKHNELRGEVNAVKTELKTSAIGSVKVEILGILAILYGLFIPLLNV